jgi:hypothetical protein
MKQEKIVYDRSEVFKLYWKSAPIIDGYSHYFSEPGCDLTYSSSILKAGCFMNDG